MSYWRPYDMFYVVHITIFANRSRHMDHKIIWTIGYGRGDSMILKNIEKVMGLQQPAGSDYVLSIE